MKFSEECGTTDLEEVIDPARQVRQALVALKAKLWARVVN
jgi:hypothetical protein